MLELTEARFILATADGKMFACYQDRESAELDAKDLAETSPDKRFGLYELIHSMKLGDKHLQNTYELRVSYPITEETEKKEG